MINYIDNGANKERADEKNGGSNMPVKPSTMKWRSRSSNKKDQVSFRKDSNWIIDIQRVCDSNGMQELFNWETDYRSKRETFKVIAVLTKRACIASNTSTAIV